MLSKRPKLNTGKNCYNQIGFLLIVQPKCVGTKCSGEGTGPQLIASIQVQGKFSPGFGARGATNPTIQ